MSKAIQVNFTPKNEKIEINRKNNIATVSSLEIAKKFKKEHWNVLRDIREIILQVEENFSQINFEGTSYKDKQGKLRPCYNITRDGFTLLAMGFTGKEAMQWKVRFIEAFNALEQHYRATQQAKVALPSPKVEDTLTSTLKALNYTAKGVSINDAAKIFNIPRSTLGGRIRRVKHALLPILVKQIANTIN